MAEGTDSAEGAEGARRAPCAPWHRPRPDAPRHDCTQCLLHSRPLVPIQSAEAPRRRIESMGMQLMTTMSTIFTPIGTAGHRMTYASLDAKEMARIRTQRITSLDLVASHTPPCGIDGTPFPRIVQFMKL